MKIRNYRLQSILPALICVASCVFLMHLFSCDGYYNYKLVNATEGQILLKVDPPDAIYIQDRDKGGVIDSSGFFIIKPDQACELFNSVSGLDKFEIPFTQLVVLTKDGKNTLFYLKNKDEILKYFKKRSVLKIK